MTRKEDWYSPGSIAAKIASWSFRESKSAQKERSLWESLLRHVWAVLARLEGCVFTLGQHVIPVFNPLFLPLFLMDGSFSHLGTLLLCLSPFISQGDFRNAQLILSSPFCSSGRNSPRVDNTKRKFFSVVSVLLRLSLTSFLASLGLYLHTFLRYAP